MSRVIAVMACGFTVAACSTSMPSLEFLKSAPQAEALRIESEPPGAEAKISSGQSCRTPCELTVEGGGEHSITLALNGYEPQTVSIRPEKSAAGALGGVMSAPKLAPNPVHVELQPAPAPAVKKPAAKKKKPVAAAHPKSTPVASAAPAPAPAPVLAPEPPAEAAASATNYPWPSR